MNLHTDYYNDVSNDAVFQPKFFKILKCLIILLTVSSSAFVNAQITSYPYEEDFETSDGNWKVKGTTTTWELGTPSDAVISSAASGTKAWVTNLDGFYMNNENGWVESPVFDFSNLTTPAIELSIWWECENNIDGVVLQSSIDTGNSWQIVGDDISGENWYNNSSLIAAPGGQSLGWSGIRTNEGSNAWLVARQSLANLAGETNVIFRMVFATDNSVFEEGIAFDLIKIFEAECNYAGENGNLETCGGISDEDLFNELGGNPDPNGVWTHPAGGDEIGIHTYTFVATALCPESTATVTVTQTPLAYAGGSNAVPYSGGEIDLFEQLLNSEGKSTTLQSKAKNVYAVREPDEGGVWLDEGDEEIPTGKVSFPDLPAGSYTKVFTYTVFGDCASEDESVVELLIDIPFDIGSDATLEICTDANLTESMLFEATGGDPNSGGTWDPVLDGANTYIYDHNGETVQVIVTEVTPKSAGVNGTFEMNPAYTLTVNDLFTALGPTADPDGDWTPAVSGIGTYTYKHSGPCPETSAQVVVTESLLGVEDIERLGIRVFPNPSSGKLFISGELSKIDRLEIYSMYGQRIQVIRKNFKEINIDQLTAAVYIVKLFTEVGVGSIKIIKQ